MLRTTRDHVVIKDPAGRYVFANPAAAEWFCMPVESIVGRTNVEIWGAAHAAAIASQDRALLIDCQAMEYEEVQTKDGITRTWLTTKDVMRDASGNVIAYASISREITDRVAAEQALACSDEALQQNLRLFNGVLERTSDHMSVRDIDGRFLMANRSCAEWYGHPAEFMLGRTCDELFSPAEAAIVRARDLVMLESGMPLSYEEAHLQAGKAHIFLTTRDVIRDETGRIVAHFAISREITDLRQAEAQAQQSQ